MNNGTHGRAKHYHWIKRRLFFLSLTFDLAALCVWSFAGWSAGLREWSWSVAEGAFFARSLFLVLFGTFLLLLHLPFNMYGTFYLEHRFGLSAQSFWAWCRDEAKKAAVGFLVFFTLAHVICVFLGLWPRTWWMAATGFWLLFSLFLAHITPRVIVPLFFRYTPVEDEELRRRIARLFDRCGVLLKDVYTIDLSRKSSKANAFICGLGSSRRVVLSDTLVKGFTREEIETVVAHEMSHYKHHDIVWMALAQTLAAAGSFFLVHLFLSAALPWFGFERLDDIAFLPVILLAFSLVGLVLTPLMNAFSRHLEVRADRFAITLTGKTDDFISMMRKLAERNLAEWDPRRLDVILFYDHPPVARRIRLAEEHAGTE